MVGREEIASCLQTVPPTQAAAPPEPGALIWWLANHLGAFLKIEPLGVHPRRFG